MKRLLIVVSVCIIAIIAVSIVVNQPKSTTCDHVYWGKVVKIQNIEGGTEIYLPGRPPITVWPQTELKTGISHSICTNDEPCKKNRLIKEKLIKWVATSD